MLLVLVFSTDKMLPVDEFLWTGIFEELATELQSRGWSQNNEELARNPRFIIRVTEIGEPVAPGELQARLDSRSEIYQTKPEVTTAPE